MATLIDVTMPTIVKVAKNKIGSFEHTVSISKWPAESAHKGYIVCYLIYLFALFPKGLEVDLEGSTFSTLMLSMYIDSLGLFFKF